MNEWMNEWIFIIQPLRLLLLEQCPLLSPESQLLHWDGGHAIFYYLCQIDAQWWIRRRIFNIYIILIFLTISCYEELL